MNNSTYWYEFTQNNSGGSFVVDDKVCHRIYIEAEDFREAVIIAESLGCYWNGVEKGIDCPCCGDRWSKWDKAPIDLEEYNTKGINVEVYDGIYSDTKAKWNERYGHYEIIECPKFVNDYGRTYKGRIKIKNIEEYAQFMADSYSWTIPDARIYYKDGTVKEIFSKRSD